MADEPPRAGGKTLAGQPLWVWAAGAVALIGGYIYLRSKGQAAGSGTAQQPATTTGGTSPTGMSWDQFLLFVHDQQGSSGTGTGTTPGPAPAPGPAPKPAQPAAKPKLYWSGALGKWLTGAQWHQWHIQHLQHVAAQKKAG